MIYDIDYSKILKPFLDLFEWIINIITSIFTDTGPLIDIIVGMTLISVCGLILIKMAIN